MGLSTSKKKTTTNTTSSTAPLQQYQPYIDAGAAAGLDLLNKGQPGLDAASKSAMDVYNGLGSTQNTLGGIYGGSSPAQQGYKDVQNAAANDQSTGMLAKFAAGGTNPASSLLAGYAAGGNDPSMDPLKQLSQGSKSPGSYDSIGANNPAIAALMGMTNQQVNGDTKQFYQDTLNGKYLNNNPYIDTMAKQAEDAALKSVNQRYAASGMGEGFSTPYAQAAGSSVADANNTLRYTNYNNELNRMGTIGGQSDSQYNATKDRSLSAANMAGTQYTNTGQLQLGAQQAKDAAFNSDRNSQLAAAQSLGSQYTAGQNTGVNAASQLGSQYLTGQGQQIAAAQALGSQNTANNQTSLNATNANMQSILSALGLSAGTSAAQLSALQTAGQLPYTGLNAYAGDMNSLIGKYATQTGSGTSTEKSTGSFMDYLMQMQKNAASAMGGG